MNTYFISDLHLGDENIIRYENRPFKLKEEMDELIISNWNNTVQKEDTVFVLGDVSSYSKAKTRQIIKKLNGYKILIMGNHDREKGNRQYFLDLGFDEVSMYPMIFQDFFMLSHEPLYVNSNMPYANIHGHTHNNSFDNIQFVNVSVEKINYTPINFNEIIKRFKTTKVKGGNCA